MNLVRSLLLLAAVFVTAASANAARPEPPQADAIRHVLKETWDKPAAPVEVSPVVVVADYAIAGWTQDAMGGRALLRKKGDAWTVVLCAGDQLLDADVLHKTGIPQATARQLAHDVAQAESAISPERVRMFARFEGLVTMDGHHGHLPAH